ncbi:protein artichoke-like [Leguminivora glycinivorella]|uniref:protein artichoke-like n=1 Tax=Leguminivora glycinivorella TaxID=1035111 RepID=UPI00200D23E1|nr:protein artichoke-like [Leguminivora glycinivorella]
MDYAIARRILFVIILVAANQLDWVDGGCELNDLERRICEAELTCSYDFEPGLNLVTDWSCIQHDYNDYNYGIKDEDYIIYLKADNIDETHSFNPFNMIYQLSDHIHTLSFTNGKMNSIPGVFFYLYKVTTIDLSHNTIELINLAEFSKLANLNMLNVSCNQIVDLEDYDRTSAIGFSQLHTIDLSHNAIKAIPDRYFSRFPNLLHLNLSHNYIKSFSVLSFEGLIQLQTLHVSDNELTEIGAVFASLTNIKELFLDHNYLAKIEKNVFNTIPVLENLNLSWNSLADFEPTVFDSMVALRKLDLSSNKIKVITKRLFLYNLNLQSLDISLNLISKIEPGAFEGKHIVDFKIDDIPFSGCLQKNIFQGIFMKKLDLSRGNITELGPELFEDQFEYLNFRHNFISKIDKMTFSKLRLLTDLDLSYNQLQSIEFDTSNLKNLSYFYVNNNKIKTISKDMFAYLRNLQVLDLSYNIIEEVQMQSFEHLNKIKILKLNNNPLLTVMPSQLLKGLVSCTVLDLSYTRVNKIKSQAFEGMKSLQTFNSSHSNLTVLETNAFGGTGSIQVLDFSYNEIEIFSLNNTSIKLVGEIDLQYNKLQYITGNTFLDLTDLRWLSLRGNNLLRIENDAFRNLHNLLKIDISANQRVVFNSSIFSGLQSLSLVLLNNITSRFKLGDIVNSSIAGFDLSFCNITDINYVSLNPIITLERLKLASNKIVSINKSSFQKLRQLSWIDLSYNQITIIQPGSFSINEDLSILDLSNNLLSSLKFGVFDGLVNLNTLDLSSNTLHSFSASIFHNTPRVRLVYLDNNLIEKINFYEFSNENIKEIYLGGNRIPCDSLTKLKKMSLTFTVKARNGVYDTENVDGITCIGIDNEMNKTHANDTAVTAISNGSLNEFQLAVEKILNKSESFSLEKFLDVLNQTEAKNNAFLNKLVKSNQQVTGGIYRILENIQEYLKLQNSVSVESHPPVNDELQVNNNTENLAHFKKQIMFQEEEHEVKPNVDSNSKELKYPLYFIAACLAVLLCMVILSFALFLFRLRNTGGLAHSINLSYSREPISNMMEME